MTLEAEDIRSIQGMVDRAIPRTEYENRHVELVSRVTRLEDMLNSQIAKASADHTRLQENIDNNHQRLLLLIEDRFNRISARADDTNKQIDEAINLIRDTREEQLKSMNETKDITLRYMVATIVSFLISIGTIIITRIFH